MIVIGVDPGSIKLGYGIIRAHARGARLEYLACGLLSAPAAWPAWKRYVEIGRDLQSLAVDVQAMREADEDVACAIEAGFVNGQQGALVSGAARGIATFILGAAFGEVRSYSPASVKLAATGHGNAAKDHVARLVGLRLAMKTIPGPDEGDALAIAISRAVDG